MTVRATLQRAIRPSRTRSTASLWAKSLLNAALFFAVFMVLAPWLAHGLLPAQLPVAPFLRTWVAGAVALAGAGVWAACLAGFTRHGRGTPLPADAPRHLVTTGWFGRMRNPIMAGELAIIWAEALHFASLGMLLYAAVISVVAHLAVVYVEEPELRKRFGESYDAYCRSVPRWLPRLGRRA
jgi:protein-S-isoprenylcysteine O-methyltransferase Ste14